METEQLHPDPSAYRFLATMGHAIRTPIRTLMGMAELLPGSSPGSEQVEYARQIKSSSETLLALFEDMLDYARIEAGKLTPDQGDFDLEQTLQQAVDAFAAEAHAKGLEIAMDIPPDAAIIINGDGGKFRRILGGLIKNAVESSEASRGEGGVSITVRLRDFKGGEAVYVSVADTGPVLSEEDRKRFLNPFPQVSEASPSPHAGTDLALALSRSLTELMGGRMEILSSGGVAGGTVWGSIFRFTLPILRSAAVPPPLDLVSRDRGMRILLADDRPTPRFITASYLGDMGYANIDCTTNGAEALAALNAAALGGHPYRLCIIDLNMPVMDGRQLAAEIRKNSNITGAAMILMVPRDLLSAEDRQILLKEVDALVDKPIGRRNLAKTIKLALAAPARTPESPLEPLSFAPAAPGPAANKPPVLIVEDHPLNRKLFSLIVEKMGYPVILADDGQEGLNKAESGSAALVFMDIEMPRMDGYEAARALRKQGFRRPIIAVTAAEDEGEYPKAAGIDDVLFKPFKKDDIEQMLLKWICRKQEGPAFDPVVAAAFDADPGAEEIFSSRDLMANFMDNMDTIKSLLGRFLERTGGQIAAIPGFAEQGDWESARREAHTIKGSSLTMGGKHLGRAAARLEQACKAAAPEETRAALKPVEEAFIRFKAAAEQFLSEH
ncbi:hybrid sensor histidine kinase/response regulator [Spirochaetia bacterium]|nr:hybrid sensor histidine kinase/response regulator [Spirochaetia bacterium]